MQRTYVLQFGVLQFGAANQAVITRASASGC